MLFATQADEMPFSKRKPKEVIIRSLQTARAVTIPNS